MAYTNMSTRCLPLIMSAKAARLSAFPAYTRGTASDGMQHGFSCNHLCVQSGDGNCPQLEATRDGYAVQAPDPPEPLLL